VPDETTPPHGTRTAPLEPPRPIPTLANVHNLLSGVAGQIGGARGDIDAVVEKLEGLTEAVKGLSTPPAPPAESSAPAEDARPTLRVRAGRGGRWVLVGVGALSLVAQVVALSQRPEYGPLVAAAKVLGTALLDLARSMGAAP
jgi:hypothetical protein